jgi:cob(I)alamin adenosyltransferase
MKIYTKVGDGGGTFLSGGKKARKNDPVVEALGAVDELNAAVGWARSLDDVPALERVQRLLFVLGAELSGAKAPRVQAAHAAWAEKEIDALEASLPLLRQFILPGGSPAGAALHLARAVCRRAERRLIPLLKKKRASKEAQVFLNRLSDLLFMMARDANRRAGRAETTWSA